MILLTALNSSYIHSNLAVWSIKAQLDKENFLCRVLEETINSPYYSILSNILKHNPDVLCFSCYIWNIEIVKRLITDISKVQKDIKIILGGPEVTYCSEELLNDFPQIDYIIKGDGEQAIVDVMKHIYNRENEKYIENKGIQKVENLGGIQNHTTLEYFQNIDKKIAYVESSRGCPFSCSYCLSSIDKTIRYFPLDEVKMTIQSHIDNGFKLIKFTDRTFNIDKNRMLELLNWLKEKQEEICFHFEVAADLFDDETITFLNDMEKGKIQLEVGVQSSNIKVLEECNRRTNLEKIKDNITKILFKSNIHVHLDLIAGLPYEDFKSIVESFDFVYLLQPHQIQLGFLKLLKGTAMRERALEYGMKYMDKPPYQVLETKWISYRELDLLNYAAWAIDKYYNTARFINTLKYIEQFFLNPLDMFIQLGLKRSNIAVSSRGLYEDLYSLISERTDEKNLNILKEYLKLDFHISNVSKRHPEFLGNDNPKDFKKLTRKFLSNEDNIKKYLPELAYLKCNEIIKHTHFEVFLHGIGKDNDKKIILFKYFKKDSVTEVYKYTEIPIEIFFL